MSRVAAHSRFYCTSWVIKVTLCFTDDADNRPVILWSAYFNVADTTGIGHHNSVLADQNLLVLSGPNADLDFDLSIEEVSTISINPHNTELFKPWRLKGLSI